jgi:hypothetical protein
MARNFWHRYVNRPIDIGDEGRFVLGRGHGGWTVGYVAIHNREQLIDRGDTSGSRLSRHVAVSGLQIYTFLNSPPPWEEDLNPIPDPPAKVVKFKGR